MRMFLLCALWERCKYNKTQCKRNCKWSFKMAANIWCNVATHVIWLQIQSAFWKPILNALRRKHNTSDYSRVAVNVWLVFYVAGILFLIWILDNSCAIIQKCFFFFVRIQNGIWLRIQELQHKMHWFACIFRWHFFIRMLLLSFDFDAI